MKQCRGGLFVGMRLPGSRALRRRPGGGLLAGDKRHTPRLGDPAGVCEPSATDGALVRGVPSPVPVPFQILDVDCCWFLVWLVPPRSGVTCWLAGRPISRASWGV